MSKFKIIFSVLLCLTFVACVGGGRVNPSKMNHLSVGMTKAEVLRALGNPQSTSASKGIETLNYYHDHGMWVFTPYYVRLVNGKVDSYGKQNPTQNIEANVDVNVNQK